MNSAVVKVTDCVLDSKSSDVVSVTSFSATAVVCAGCISVDAVEGLSVGTSSDVDPVETLT